MDEREKEAREEEEKTAEQTEDKIDLTPYENEKVLKWAYISFVIPGITKADIDSYNDRA